VVLERLDARRVRGRRGRPLLPHAKPRGALLVSVRAAFVAVVRTLAATAVALAAGDVAFLGLRDDLPRGTDDLGVRPYLLVDPVIRLVLAGVVFFLVPRGAARVRSTSSAVDPVAGARLASVGVGVLASAQALRSAASAAAAPGLARASSDGWIPSDAPFGWVASALDLGVVGVAIVGRARIVAFVDRWFLAPRPDRGPGT